MKAVIMAGGKGTRLSSFTGDIPKPMIEIDSRPVLLHQIEIIKRYNIKEIIITVGYLKEVIMNYFGDGKEFDVDITYIVEDEPLGTAGSFFYLKDIITEDFFVIFGDVLFDIDLNRFYSYHVEKKGIATIFVHPNSHPYDSDLVELDQDGRVCGFDKKGKNRDYYYSNCVNAGAYIFSRDFLELITEPQKLALEKDLIFKILNEKMVFGYKSTEYIKDMGTHDRLETVTGHYKSGLIKKRNLSKPQRCIFIDRDGTINKLNGLISNTDQFELEENVVDAVKLINDSGYLCIVITNQPVIARNLCDFDDLKCIHMKMETLLGEKGAYVDDLFFCPHHPDSGYPEERKEYKIKCDCRKPNTGLIQKAAALYNIDLLKSYIIGDSTTDIMTGKNAGLKTVLVQTGEAGKDGKYDVAPDYIFNSLYEASLAIINNY